MRVYISSTRLDFEAERDAVSNWLIAADHQPVHSFVADSDTVQKSSLGDIDRCQAYILLLGHRYGLRPKDGNPQNLSITQLEFRRAGELGIPRIALLRSNNPNVGLSSVNHPVDGPAVNAFRDEVRDVVTAAEFTDMASLISAMTAAFTVLVQSLDGARATVAGRWQWPAPWDFSAYLASKRQNFTGRAWLFLEIDAWTAQPVPRDLLLRADFGVGKTAFVSELVHRDEHHADGERRIVAHHFCQHDTRETLRAGPFVQSLAAQLAEHVPAYRAAVDSSPSAQKQLAAAADDPGSAFEAAILNPLAGLAVPRAARMIVVDALDESLELEEAEAKHGTLVRLLAEKVPRFPPWIRTLITARNNPAVIDRLKFAFAPKEIDAEAHLNLQDIHDYVLRRASSEPLASALATEHVLAPDIADRLRDKSGGKFLYAVRALDDVVHGHLRAGELALLPLGMDAFYSDAFERRFERAGRDYEPARKLLGAMAAAREPLTPDLLSAVLDVRVPDLKRLRTDALSDFIRVREGVWTFDHFSLREWLTADDADGNPRAGRYALDTPAARAALAEWAMKAYHEDTARAPIHVVRHLPGYLHDANRQEPLRQLLRDLGWLDIKLSKCGPHALLQDFDFAPVDEGLTLLARTIDMCRHIFVTDPSQLSAQLLGRLQPDKSPGLEKLLADCRNWTGAAQLKPLTNSLPPPGNLVRVFPGHTDILQMCAFSGDGTRLLSASADGTARVWRINGETLATLDASAGPVNYATFSHDGQWIVTTYEERGARLWSDAGALVHVFETPTSCVWAAFSPDDALVMATCRDHVARVWRRTGEPVATLDRHSRRVVHGGFSPDGHMIVTASTDRTACLWSADGRALAEYIGHTESVARAIFSPDGAHVLTGSSDNTARIWDLQGHSLETLEGHTGPVNHVVYSPDGALIATASNDNTSRLWRASGRLVAVLKGHTGWVNHVAFSPDGARLVTSSSDGTARLWSATGDLLALFRAHSGWVVHAAFSPDGRFILTCANDETMRLWNNAGATLSPVAAHSDRITRVAFSPEGKLALTTSNDRTAVLWDRAGHVHETLRGHEELVTYGDFLSSGEEILTVSADATARIWDRTGRTVAILEGHDATINHAAASPRNGLVATASNDGTARLWLRSGKSGATLAGHADAVNHIAFSPDGETLVTCSSDTTVGLWRKDGTPLKKLDGHTGWVSQGAFSPDGHWLVTCSEDKTARLWTRDGTAAGVLAGHSDAVIGAIFARNGGELVTASKDGNVRRWRTTGELVSVLNAHAEPINQIVFAGDDRSLITCSQDGTVRVWRTGACLASLTLDAPVTAAAFNEGTIVCGDALGGVHFLVLVEPNV